MNRRITRVALLAAAALTISLASPVTAQADDAAGSGLTSAPQSRTTTAAPSATAATALSSFAINDGAIYRRGDNAVRGTLAPAVAGTSFRADVYVDGRYRGQAPLLTGGFYYTGSWGIGSVRLGPVRYVDLNGVEQVADQYSNYFRVRQGLFTKPGLKQFRMTRKGDKLTMQATKVRSFNGVKWVRVPKAVFQVKVGKKWKKFRVVKLNKKGVSKKISFSHSGKRKYRMLVRTNAKIQGGATKAIRM